MIYQYKCKFYLNASHYIVLNGQKGNEHSHCFEIVLDIATKDDNPFIKFDAIEDRINEKLNPYQNKLINNIEPFNEINPTIENICEFFKNEFVTEIEAFHWILLLIEISETPSRSFIINVVEDKINKEKEDINTKKEDINTKLIEIDAEKADYDYIFTDDMLHYDI